MDNKQLIVSVRPDGSVFADTRNIYGDECLDYITLLEDLLDATTESSSYTEDHTRTPVDTAVEARNEHSAS
ncbi:DUF2997 domain-containing protein [Arthrobacter sp. Sa2CUA1]|uniref:DUF2997 domain-containing protein n=1 Tax=Arthrobacter gallicola TaxID=2762225 RepID=A0ABR8UW31_9MICC|nr:DUF2997 domain-containing protein [Arthrobacter gallicola]MBD7996742.1 DUF2997 domain-containing protein [Arthrobacter gallicola]